MPGIDAVAIEFAGPSGRDDDRLAREHGEPQGIVLGPAPGGDREHPDAALLRAPFHQEPDGGHMIEDRHAQPDRLFRQRLHHEPRRTRATARRTPDLVMVGLIAQRAPEAVLRDRQPHELQGRQRAERTHRFDIGRVLVHRAACAKRVGHRREVIAPPGAVGGMEGLLVRAGAGGRAAERALGHDHDVEVSPLHFDRGPQSGGAAAEHQRFAAMEGN